MSHASAPTDDVGAKLEIFALIRELAIFVTIAFGALPGLANGLLIAYIRLPSLKWKEEFRRRARRPGRCQGTSARPTRRIVRVEQ